MTFITQTNQARLWMVVTMVLLPYAVRLPGGSAWIEQYRGAGLGAFAFIQAFHVIAWAPLLFASFLLKRTFRIWISALPALGFLAFAHGTLDLAADAQSAIALIFIPVYTLPFSLAGFLVALTLQLFLTKKEKLPQTST